MDDLVSIVDSWFEPNERHPGHPDQSTHGNWAKNAVKKTMGGGKDDGGGSSKPSSKPKVEWGSAGGSSLPKKHRPRKGSVEALEGEMADAEAEANKFSIAMLNKHGTDDPGKWPAADANKFATLEKKANAAEAKFKAAKAAERPPRRPRVKKQTGNTMSSALASKLSKEAMADFHAYTGGPRAAGELKYCRGYAERASARQGQPGDPIDFTASTPGVKRDGLDLRGNGWRLDNYRKSPVFQWCHDKNMPPLGRVEATAAQSLQARVFFDQEDEFARKVESKYRRGFLHAVSVGWDFVDGHGTRLNTGRLSLDEIRDRAFYDLTELSGVPVPADPDALIARQRSGLRTLGRELVSIFDEQEHGTALAEEVRQALDDELERLGLTIPLLQRAARRQPARTAGFFMPNTGPADTGISQDAARNLLAAFTLQGAK